MTAATDILTPEEAEQALNLPNNSARQAAMLERRVSALSAAIDEYAGPVVAREVIETHYADGQHSVRPREQPVYSVTSVTEYPAGSGTVLTAEDYDTSGTYLLALEQGTGYVLYRRQTWTTSTFNGIVRLVYNAGRFANTAAVSAQYKEAAGEVLVRIQAQYGAAWARGGDAFGNEGVFPFFRVLEPVMSDLGIKKRVRALVA